MRDEIKEFLLINKEQDLYWKKTLLNYGFWFLDLASITQTIADSISTELGYIGGIIYFYDN